MKLLKGKESSNGNEMEKITVEELFKIRNSEGKDYIVVGIPTGMYADRGSYGNRPILTFILDGKLPCKASAYPYTTKPRIREGVDEVGDKEVRLFKRISDLEFCADNENLGLAAAFLDQAIRNKNNIEVHGKYSDNILNTNYLKIENFGFQLEDHKFPGTEI